MRHCQYPRSIIMTSVMQSHAAITHVRRQRASASRCRRHRHRNCHHHSSVTAAAARKCCGLTERHGGRAVIDCRHSAGAWLSFFHPPTHTHTRTHTHASVLARTAARGRIGWRRRRRRARVHQGATHCGKVGLRNGSGSSRRTSQLYRTRGLATGRQTAQHTRVATPTAGAYRQLAGRCVWLVWRTRAACC